MNYNAVGELRNFGILADNSNKLFSIGSFPFAGFNKGEADLQRYIFAPQVCTGADNSLHKSSSIAVLHLMWYNEFET